MKQLFLILFILSGLLFLPTSVNSHSGGLDAYGGHHCWTSCELYGYSYGEYHYHNSGWLDYSLPKITPNYETLYNQKKSAYKTLEKRYKKLKKQYKTLRQKFDKVANQRNALDNELGKTAKDLRIETKEKEQLTEQLKKKSTWFRIKMWFKERF